MDLINITFIITNILGIYSTYKLFKVFLGERQSTKYIEIISYFLYYIFNCLIFIFYHIPIILFIFNITSVFLLSFNYSGSIRKHIFSTIYIYAIYFFIQIIFIVLFEYKKIPAFKIHIFESINIIICVKIFYYIVSLVLTKLHTNINKAKDIPLVDWLAIVCIPLSTLILMILLLNVSSKNEQISIIIALFIVVSINIATFHIYKIRIAMIQEENKKIMLEKENESYLQQLKMIQMESKNISKIKHDIKNHLFVLKSLLENNKISSYNNYFDNLIGKLEKIDILKTGNTVVDSIINYKLRFINHDEVKIDMDVCIPPTLDITNFDLTIILGNLLDNSIRAIQESNNKKILNIYISYKQGRLILQIENTYKEILKSSNGKLLTTRKDSNGHGLGLQSVTDIVEKYNGIIQFCTQDNIFTTMVIVYC